MVLPLNRLHMEVNNRSDDSALAGFSKSVTAGDSEVEVIATFAQ